MTLEDMKKPGVIALMLIGLVIAYIFIKALVGGAGGRPSEAEVRAACASSGVAAAKVIEKIDASGEAKAAAGMVVAMGLTDCEGVFH
jgi:hypothetical protein